MKTITSSQRHASLIVPRSSIAALAALFLLLILALNGLAGCGFLSNGRAIYDREGILIGLEADPSVRKAAQRGVNNHPIDLSPTDLESLLQTIQISGYSGTLAALLTKPQPVPLFTPKELAAITAHLAAAFREATPTERVSFSLPKPDVTYSEDRTIGSLFFRGPYLHVVVTDHSSTIRTDTSGGDYKDIRDTKGMQLWVAGPSHAAIVPDLEEPQWAHFERVHISLPVQDVLARRAYPPAARMNQERTGSFVSPPTTMPSDHPQSTTSPEELQRQIRGLSGTNQELRDRLDAQHKQIQQLQEEVDQLRRGVPLSDPNGQFRQTAPAH